MIYLGVEEGFHLGVVTILAVIFSTLLILVYNIGKSIIVSHSDDMANAQTAMTNSQYSFYDDADIAGYDVLEAIRTMDGQRLEGNIGTFRFELITGMIQEAFDHASDASLATIRMQFPQGYATTYSLDPSAANCINEDANFHTELIREDDVVVGIRAVQILE